MATDADRAKLRLERLQALENALDEYVAAEKKRIETEVDLLTKVQSARRSGKGAASDSTKTATKLAASDLAWFLRGS